MTSSTEQHQALLHSEMATTNDTRRPSNPKVVPLEQQNRNDIVFRDMNYIVRVPAHKISGTPAPAHPCAKVPLVEKHILKNVSGTFKAGRLTAIMGASGAGKTSLLQLLAGEVHQGEIYGELLINGEHIDIKTMKKMSGFVFQDDVILGTMTVKEAISMSAILRLSKSFSTEQKMAKVDEMISMLNLEKCKDTIVGDVNIKGISGGERKRTAMAMTAITNPCVLFLDEPTSGLDTFTAHSVVSILKDLALSGRTVIATIHQPSSDVFHMFDDLLLLADGQIMYQGPIEDSVDYFAKLGYPCPQYTNPADHIFMKILNNEDHHGTRDHPEETNKQRIERLLKVFQDSEQNKEIQKLVQSPEKRPIISSSFKERASLSTQMSYLFNRASKNAFRNPMIVRAKMGQVTVISLIIGLLYLGLKDRTGTAAVQDYTGVFFFLIINNVMSSAIGVLSIFGLEKQVFSREHGAGYYSLPAYFLTKIGVEAPFQIIFPWIGATIIYFMAGFQLDVAKYFLTMVAIVLCSLCGFSLGIFFASFFSSLPTALAVTPLVLLPLMLFSGLFVNQESIPVYFNWIKYISPMKYGFEAIAKTQFEGLVIPSGKLNVPAIQGDTIIQNLGFKDDGLTVAYCFLILASFVVILAVLAYFALLRVVNKTAHSTPIRSPKEMKGIARQEKKDETAVTVA